jgi:hypothetical protein
MAIIVVVTQLITGWIFRIASASGRNNIGA